MNFHRPNEPWIELQDEIQHVDRGVVAHAKKEAAGVADRNSVFLNDDAIASRNQRGRRQQDHQAKHSFHQIDSLVKRLLIHVEHNGVSFPADSAAGGDG
jgi:hypothetical protein